MHSGREAWHLFETYLAVRRGPAGKCYKEWLFARAGGTPDMRPMGQAVEAGATLLIRDVVREHIRREYSPRRMISLATPLGAEKSLEWTVEDLLPAETDPSEEAALQEFDRLAETHAAEILEGMSRRDRVAVLAKALGLSLAHVAVQEAAGCRKSALAVAWQRVARQVPSRIRVAYPGDDEESVRLLLARVLAALADGLREWAAATEGVAALLRLAEGK